MRSFKVIKETPTSSKLGKILTPNGFGIIDPHVSIHDVEKWSEFYEEVTNKFNNGKIIDKDNNNTILKVKCKVSNVVFKIGDTVTIKNDHNIGRLKITGFTVDDDIISINTTKGIGELYCGKKGVNLCIVNKLTKALTTEDGIDKFVGDEVFYVSKKLQNKNCGTETISCSYWNTENFRYWNTKESYEKHLLFNKRCFSINDIMNLITINNEVLNTLVQSVKRRL